MKYILLVVFVLSTWLVSTSHAQRRPDDPGVQATPTPDFTFRLVDNDTRKPVQGVLITITREGYANPVKVQSLTDSDGYAAITVTGPNRKFQGDYTVLVTKSGYEDYETSVQADLYVSKRPVDFTMNLFPQRKVELTFQVYDEDSLEPIENAEVTLTREGEASPFASGSSHRDGTAKVTISAWKLPDRIKAKITAPMYKEQTRSLETYNLEILKERRRIHLKRKCEMAGTWHNVVANLGTSDWTIETNGKAGETNMGRAHGTTTLSGKTLKIHWWIGEDEAASPYVGDYEINLNDDCKSGTGTLVWTRKPTGEERGPSFTVTEFKRNP